ncbi:MAG TPA: hypothetical protein VEC12_07220, partial [Bacteroidia bacterium]|nr:hypothetical protein [Bacteroidia bacterium]
MKKPFFIFCCILVCFHAEAQEKRERDTRINYSAGYQFLKLDAYEAGNSYQLYYMMPQYTGFSKEDRFSPTLFHHFDFSTAITKNKNWLFDFNFNFGRNSIGSYRYIADKDGNPTEIQSYTGIELYTWGLGVKRKINLGKWGELLTGISLNGIE